MHYATSNEITPQRIPLVCTHFFLHSYVVRTVYCGLSSSSKHLQKLIENLPFCLSNSKNQLATTKSLQACFKQGNYDFLPLLRQPGTRVSFISLDQFTLACIIHFGIMVACS